MDQQYGTGELDEIQMTRVAKAMAGYVKAPLIVYLQGDLGAGKTTFTRAFIHRLGYPGSVKSPTYGLLEVYPLDAFNVVHLDLYRIVESGELEFLGLDDLHDTQSVFMVEWPDRGAGGLPAADLVIRFKHSNSGRSLRFDPFSEAANLLCQQLSEYMR